MKRLAIDWDESELRMVAGEVRSGGVRISDAVIVPLTSPEAIEEAVRQTIVKHDLAGVEAMLAVGRGKSELRTLQLPPVPDDELPEIVRFQAIRNFASAGDHAVVDYLVTDRTESGVNAMVAAIGPHQLSSVKTPLAAASVTAGAIILRPSAAAALYLQRNQKDSVDQSAGSNIVLVDLLANDAEIVILSSRRPVFIRTVRIPAAGAARQRALAGELRRSRIAWGGDAITQVVLWGKDAVHAEDQQTLGQACDAPVEMLDPFSLVDVPAKIRDQLPEHVGRLAPLVGMLVAEAHSSDHLIDFANPRRAPDAPSQTWKTAALIGIPIAAAVLIAAMMYGKIQALDSRIANLKQTTRELKPGVKRALDSIERTERVDQFLDGGVQWLDELSRLAEQMPSSDQLIVRSFSATTNTRDGGGVLKIEGGVVDPSVIQDFEQSLRDDAHQVFGQGASEDQKSQDAYRWGFTESIRVSGQSVRNTRYQGILKTLEPANTNDASSIDPEPQP